jgi:putative RecB family exonuclease
MSYYSHSQIWTFLTCPLKYKYDKIDGLGKTNKESSLALILWTAVHSALEFVYKQRTNLRTPEILQMFQRYEAIFRKEVKESTTEFLDEEVQITLERWHTYLKRYRETYYPFDQVITMAVEQSFSIKLDDNISFSGYIDRIDIDNERMILIDYKTSKQLEPDDADTHRQQLTLYALGMKQKYGNKFSQIDCCLIYVHLEKEILWSVQEDELNSVKNRYRENAQRIDEAKDRFEKEPNNDEIFPAILGRHCNYCPFQMICPKWKHQFMDDEVMSTDLGEKTIKSLIDEYSILAKKCNELEKEKKTIAQILLDYAQNKKVEKLYGNERQTAIQSRVFWWVRPDAERALRQYAKEINHIDDLLKTDTNALAKLIKEKIINPIDIADLVVSKESFWLGAPSKN